MFFVAVGDGEVVGAFETLVQLGGGFVEEEETAGEHDEVFAGNGVAAQVHEGGGEGHDVRHKGEHDDAQEDGERQAGEAGAVAQLGFDFVRQYGDEYEIVDAEHHFEQQQGGETYPGLRFG